MALPALHPHILRYLLDALTLKTGERVVDEGAGFKAARDIVTAVELEDVLFAHFGRGRVVV